MYVFRFCPDCGHPLPAPGPESNVAFQTCSACAAVHYRNAKPCAGALVVRDGQVLLGRRAIDPAKGCWDIPGGFLEPWEHPADAAVREVAEMIVGGVEQAADDLAELRWFAPDKLPDEYAFAHSHEVLAAWQALAGAI